jgi:peptidoglycan/LPS O-acetylase OafA/YrhL
VIYYHTFSVCQDILTGALAGFAVFNKSKWVEFIISLSRWKIVLVYLVGFVICLAKNKLFAGQFIIAERFVLSLFFAFIILEQSMGKNSVFKWGKISLLNYLGKISYGFYMYHLIVMFVICRLVEIYLPTGYYLIPLYFTASLLLTVCASAVSYKFIEAPLLHLKKKYGHE